MLEPKPISREYLPKALERAWRYRMLARPFEAESICRDILAVEPDHADARITLVLALSDQMGSVDRDAFAEASGLVATLPDDYSRCYYLGILLERRAADSVARGVAEIEELRQALQLFERAAVLRPAGNDEAKLRWNACARLLNRRLAALAHAEERHPDIPA